MHSDANILTTEKNNRKVEMLATGEIHLVFRIRKEHSNRMDKEQSVNLSEECVNCLGTRPRFLTCHLFCRELKVIQKFLCLG